MAGQCLILAPESYRQQHPAVGGHLPSSHCRAVRYDDYSDFRRLMPSNFSMYFS